jgi:hypothetical protein
MVKGSVYYRALQDEHFPMHIPVAEILLSCDNVNGLVLCLMP